MSYQTFVSRRVVFVSFLNLVQRFFYRNHLTDMQQSIVPPNTANNVYLALFYCLIQYQFSDKYLITP